MKILFMGTPEFSLICLKRLYEAGHEIIGVLTQPDKPKGRKMILTPSPVKVFAKEKDIPVFQPSTLKNESFKSELESLDPDIIVVVAYGKILPSYILDYPEYGCINVHTSLLPKYRGAAPMQRAIMAGEKVTGVTIMSLDEGLDTGDILEVCEVPIDEDDDLESLHDKLAEAGKELLVKTISDLEGKKVVPKKQEGEASYADKIEKEDCLIDFSLAASEIYDRIRALSPAPLAFCYHKGKILKISCAKKSGDNNGAPAGTVTKTDKNSFTVACGTGSLEILGVVPEGKGKMSAGDFVRGRGIDTGDVLKNHIEACHE